MLMRGEGCSALSAGSIQWDHLAVAVGLDGLDFQCLACRVVGDRERERELDELSVFDLPERAGPGPYDLGHLGVDRFAVFLDRGREFAFDDFVLQPGTFS